MTELPSPPASRLRTPGWLDARLVLGVLLVLISMLVGARVVSAADTSVRVYAATRDLPAGTALGPSDLRVTRVRLFDNAGRYVAATGPVPTGYVLARAVGAAEFLPRNALTGAAQPATRLVTVAVARHHLPPGLQRGDVVDVYVTGKGAAGVAAPPTAPNRALAGVPVDMVTDAGGRLGAADDVGVVLRVPLDSVPAAVAASQSGGVDLVRVPPEPPSAAPASRGSRR